ncbi:MAG: Gfo/Idh/MocA family oxidoreductase [Anaerolineae bacterium]|nr:Gfo/Idh/MocA family oxidoreductase [Anaerolineae bacterium]
MAEQADITKTVSELKEGEIPELGIGILGHAFMGKAHSNAFKILPYMMYPPVAMPRLVGIAGRNEEAVQEAARRYGYERAYTDWRRMIRNRNVHVFDNGASNDVHATPCIYAAEHGKHVICEKPLARSAAEARRMLEAVQKAGVKHMVAFNYRFVPAIVQAKKLIDSGALGRIYHFRAVYLQERLADPTAPKTWRQDKKTAGSGALGDLGAHIIDLGRFLVGEPKRVSGMTRTFIEQRPRLDGSVSGSVDVDDAFVAWVEFENGALGTLEASRMCHGRKNYNCIEINAEKGTLRFDLEKLNALDVYWADEEPKETRGFHNVLVTEAYHPYWENWWPRGHVIGWVHTFVHEFHHFFGAIVGKWDVIPWGADFVDGYKNAVICDAILKSSRSGRAVDVAYDL